MNKFLLICLLTHILGDYYLQNDTISENKQTKVEWLFLHSFLYIVPYILLFLISTCIIAYYFLYFLI